MLHPHHFCLVPKRLDLEKKMSDLMGGEVEGDEITKIAAIQSICTSCDRCFAFEHVAQKHCLIF